MKLRSIRLRNFRLHKDTTVHFPDRGVVALLGANGSGKSSILEGIAWALFGTAAIRGDVGTLRWRQAGPRKVAEVTLYFEVRGQGYMVHRTETNATVTTWPATTDGALAVGTAAVNEYLPRLIGMTYKEFRASYLCEQKQLAQLAAMKPAEREQFFRHVMGIGRIDTALQMCRERKNALGSELTGLAAGLGEREPLAVEFEEAEKAVYDLEAALNAARLESDRTRQTYADRAEFLAESERRRIANERAKEGVQQLRLALARAEAQTSQIEQGLQEARRAAERVAADADRLAELPRLRPKRDELEEQRRLYDERVSVEQSIRVAQGDLADYRLRAEQCQATIAAFDSGRIVTLQRQATDLKQQLEKLRTARHEAIAAANQQEKSARDEMHRYGAQRRIIETKGINGACPTCMRKLGEQLQPVLEGLDALVEDARRRVEKAAADREEIEKSAAGGESAVVAALKQLEPEIEAERDRRAAAQRAEQDLQTWQRKIDATLEAIAERRLRLDALKDAKPVTETEIADLKERIRQLDELDRARAADRALSDRIPVLEEELAAAQRDIAKQKRMIAEREREIPDFDLERHQKLQARVDELRTAKEKAAEIEARADADYKAAQHRRTRAEVALREYDRRAAQLRATEALHRTHERADAALDRFRREQMAALRPELEELVSGFVSVLTDGRHEAATIDSDFSVILSESGVDTPVISGGTEDIAAIAMRLAVSQKIAERAGLPASLLILDEPFGSLDDVRRANVLNLIQRLPDVFPQVLLVSHIEETRTAADVVHEIEFDAAEGHSVVRTQGTTYEIADQQEEAAA